MERLNSKKRGKVIHNGIDVDLFAYNETNRQEIRKKLGLEEKFVIGHTGHFYPVKNQIFLINLMPEIIQNNKESVLIDDSVIEKGRLTDSTALSMCLRFRL